MPFKLYKYRKEEKTNVLIRLTLILVPAYLILMWVVLILKWIVTGKGGFSEKFLNKFHYPWWNKLGL
jgi:hypothetical protein